MFFKKYSNWMYLLFCVAALGLGVLVGYIGGVFVDKYHVASVVETPTSAPEQSSLPFIEPTPPKWESAQPANAGAQEPMPSEEASASPRVVARYIIREYMGQIAVYEVDEAGESKLSTMLGVDISTLPEHDRERLKEGIEVYTEEEMLQLLEDYMS